MNREAVLALADDEHLMGHRHSEWICVTPFLEEDLAFASIGQDELGHAAALYGLLTDDVEGLVRRSPEEYRSCWLVEAPCRTWEHALVRHFLYDTAERHRWDAIRADATDPRLPALAERALREEDYHRRHATALVTRLLDGTEESRHRITRAIDELLPLAVALWEPAPPPTAWRAEVDGTLARCGVSLTWPDVDPDLQAGRTRRSEHFDEIHHALTEVMNLDPAASW